MEVETFECSETASEPIEASEEAIRLIDEMELDGQRELVSQVADSGRPGRFPFRMMTADEFNVYKAVCPTAIELSKYNASPIPLRVLQCIALCKMYPDQFDRIEIWDKTSSEIKDPVAVAFCGSYAPKSKTYILARWGSELESWPTLVDLATSLLRDRMQSTLSRVAALAGAKSQLVGDMTLESLSKTISTWDIENL